MIQNDAGVSRGLSEGGQSRCHRGVNAIIPFESGIGAGNGGDLVLETG